MGENKFDRVGSNLIDKGNITTLILILVPLFYDMVIRVGLAWAVMVTLSGLLAYGLIMLLLMKFAARSRHLYFFTMVVTVLAYASFYSASLTPLSPFAFIGVIPAGLMTYAYGRRGRVLGHLLVLNTIIWNYLFIHGGDVGGWPMFSQLIGYLAIGALLIEFVSTSIELSKQEMQDVIDSSHQIRVEHQRMLSLINNIGDAVIAIDQEGVILTYNGAALELLDTNVSLTGKRLKEVWDIVDKEGQPVDILVESRRTQRTIRRNDIRLRYGDDDFANLYVNVTPIKVGYGQQAEKGFTLILRDITKEKSLEEERDEFVSVVSHELRTPITITEGKLSNALLLLDKDQMDTDKLRNSLGQAHDQVVYLSNMINDLAALARAERTESRMDLEQVDPKRLVEELAANYRIAAEEQGLAMKTDVSDQPLGTIYTSRLYLQEVLQNFVTNALKYTKEGSVTLGLQPAGESRVVFTVRDTGIGINTSDQKHLFDKFFRSEDYRTRESTGTGLGLYVTHKLADKLQGKIEVFSRLNEGSTFKLTVGSLEDKPRRGVAVAS